MKYNFLLSLTALFLIGCKELSTNSNIENHIKNEIIDTLNIVQQIEKYKATIEVSKMQLKNSQRDIYESTEGGLIKTYYKGSDTLKKEIVYYGEIGNKIIDIYQKNGKSIVIKDKDIVYKEPIGINSNAEIIDSIINIFYLDNKQKLIFWLQNGKKVPISEYKKKEEEIISNYN